MIVFLERHEQVSVHLKQRTLADQSKVSPKPNLVNQWVYWGYLQEYRWGQIIGAEIQGSYITDGPSWHGQWFGKLQPRNSLCYSQVAQCLGESPLSPRSSYCLYHLGERALWIFSVSEISWGFSCLLPESSFQSGRFQFREICCARKQMTAGFS